MIFRPDVFKEKIKFNSFDDFTGLDRRSCLGSYILNDGIPLNPKGRQGISGRGSLNFWGPNHFFEIIITRFSLNKYKNLITNSFSFRLKKNIFGNYVYDTEGKIIVEFVVMIKMNSKWRFPSVKINL